MVKQVDLILQDKLVFDQNYINPKMKYIQTKKLIFIKIKIKKKSFSPLLLEKQHQQKENHEIFVTMTVFLVKGYLNQKRN